MAQADDLEMSGYSVGLSVADDIESVGFSVADDIESVGFSPASDIELSGAGPLGQSADDMVTHGDIKGGRFFIAQTTEGRHYACIHASTELGDMQVCIQLSPAAVQRLLNPPPVAATTTGWMGPSTSILVGYAMDHAPGSLEHDASPIDALARARRGPHGRRDRRRGRGARARRRDARRGAPPRACAPRRSHRAAVHQ